MIDLARLASWMDDAGLAGKGEPISHRFGARQGLAYQLTEGIALLSKVDWRSKGLGDLGRPDGFHERQVDRWTATSSWPSGSWPWSWSRASSGPGMT